MAENVRTNPLGTEPIPKLLVNFAVPSIIAMLVSSLYNLVDQIFIGHAVGPLGNAATNIVFPLNTTCTSVALLFGIGGAAVFNLAMGEKRTDEAPGYAGSAFGMLVIVGTVLTLISELFLTPMLRFFGSPEDVLPYAAEYTRVVAFGMPFLISSLGGGHLIRADGSPKYMPFCNLSGAVLNTVLDALFVFGFRWGMFGAALATVIGQVLSFSLVVRYMTHFKTVRLTLRNFIPDPQATLRVVSLGTAPFFNQIAMMVVQIVMNKSLKYYGGLSVYGESIPLACSGIVMKVAMIFFSIVIGISQSMQPLVSYNYGARKYDRVLESFRLALTASAVVSLFAFLAFQLLPRQIIALFGSGSEEYFQFAVRYFRIYMMMVLVTFIQPLSSNFFTAIGKPGQGVFLSLTRQIIFLLPLIVVLPMFFGIDGLIYAGPVADVLSVTCASVLASREWRLIREKQRLL
jgi:putative MATE family efflux protein